jgi:NTP pyrophosphatase (non-canonical NTP hydrolase)
MTEETINKILKFRDDRDWKQFHNPKDLAISISLEAAELLEVFQWSGTDTSNKRKQEKIKEELADVVNYCVLMADACNLDLDEIVYVEQAIWSKNIGNS